MKLAGLTVCVDYADKLARSLDRWVSGLDELLVVTAPHDLATHALCTEHHAWCLQTDVFWDDGAYFNKAAAMVEGIKVLSIGAFSHRPPHAGPDWRAADFFLFFDADVIPPPEWRALVDMANPQVGTLYGAARQGEDGKPFPDGELGGFFQLFSTRDERVQGDPMLDVKWKHAGGYDSEFEFRWPTTRRVKIPGLVLTHIGEHGRNWFGVGNEAKMDAMLSRRRELGRWDDEMERLP